MINTSPLDSILIRKDGSGLFEGEKAVKVYHLTLIAQILKLELLLARGGLQSLKEAKSLTGLKTNKRELQLERILMMLEQAKREVVYLEEA